MSLIENRQPLQPEYVPAKLTEREEKQGEILREFDAGHLSNLLFHGPRGTGKTLLAHRTILDLKDSLSGHYIPCNRYDTQYKVLQQLRSSMNGEEPTTGYHTSRLERDIEEQLKHRKHVLVLDELDFLLLNDGNDLLYFLSRVDASENLGLILISSNTASLEDQVDERTYSTLQPRRIGLEPYTPEQVYNILAQRARQSLEPSSLHHEALTYITSATTNTKHALHWLRHTARNTDDPITEETVRNHRDDAYQSIISHTLSPHTNHHSILFDAIQELDQDPVRSGDIYTAYREACADKDVEPLSNRRISDHLKHLEYYDLIESEYHYGGTEGKTRKISQNQL